MPDEEMKWPGRWMPVDEAMDAVLCSQLKRELPPAHGLYGCSVSALARDCGSDDVLFRVHGSPDRFALVHLTWHVEGNAEFPGTVFYSRLEEWLTATLENLEYDET